MKSLQIVSAKDFISKLTGGKLSDSSINRTIAYLRAKGIVFYDNWSGEHCATMDSLSSNKLITIEALKVSMQVK